MPRRTRPLLLAAASAGAIAALTGHAQAQTWALGRQGPGLRELFAIDRTGESSWLYGQEDLAGDGLATFRQQEQSIDIRTAYAASDDGAFFFRVYVSDTAPAGGNVSAYIFIDSDQNRATGGTAAASAIDARFTSDSSGGGYEFVLGVRGNQSVIGLWQWQQAQGAWTTLQTPPNRAAAEAGSFLDPIRINGDTHGYLQGRVALGEVNLTAACLANLFVRTTNETAALGAGDLEVGQVGTCAPADGNGNGVPDVVEPPPGCTSNAQCPNGGVCVNGRCILAPACLSDADCSATERCDNGRCVARPTNTPCASNAECNGLVCLNGMCGPCTAGGQCESGLVCGPDGRCTDGSGAGGSGPTLAPGEEVRGGACACSIPGSGSRSALLGAVLPLLVFVRRRFRRSPARRRSLSR
jgi:Cys-rich repeat protein